jgi:hypothetical protein
MNTIDFIEKLLLLPYKGNKPMAEIIINRGPDSLPFNQTYEIIKTNGKYIEHDNDNYFLNIKLFSTNPKVKIVPMRINILDIINYKPIITGIRG